MVSRRALAVLRPRWMLWWSGWVDRGMRAVRVGGGGGRVVEPFLANSRRVLSCETAVTWSASFPGCTAEDWAAKQLGAC